MSYILIGGAGFVGSRLREVLPDSIVYDVTSSGNNYCDITNVETFSFPLGCDDTVVLLAAEHRDDVSPRSRYYTTNVGGTQSVLDYMDRNGCTKMIFISSVAVYGLDLNNPSEQSKLNPFNDYGRSKKEAEACIKDWFDKSPGGKCVSIIGRRLYLVRVIGVMFLIW